MNKLGQSIKVGIITALIEMKAHKLRSGLSVLGVMLGVASLVAMLSLVGGIDVFLNVRMGKWAGSIWFRPTQEISAKKNIAFSRSMGMRLSDGHYLKSSAKETKEFYPKIEQYGIIYIVGQKRKASVRGMDAFTISDEMENFKVEKGRWLNNNDQKLGTTVCMISWRIADRICDIMQYENREKLIGKKCNYKGLPLQIVGIFEPKNPDSKPWHWRRAIVTPLKTAQKYIAGIDPNPGSLRILVTDPEQIKDQAVKISKHLEQNHRGVEDFEYQTAEWLEEISSLLENVNLLMWIVSMLSLIIGGLSIMNVMLSSIAERIHEIGVRKALGAQTSQIFIQFIAESSTLSMVGGIIGIGLGMIPMIPGIREAIRKSTDGSIEPTILVSHIIYVCIIIVSVGIVFGLYPAIKASRMDPIDALRYE